MTWGDIARRAWRVFYNRVFWRVQPEDDQQEVTTVDVRSSGAEQGAIREGGAFFHPRTPESWPMAAAIIPQALGVIGTIGGLFGGSNKNALRDQQEAARYALAKGGDVTSAQGIYHDSLPQNKQTAERIKDDQGYWAQLQGAGWTVDASGTVHAPRAAAVSAPAPTSWTSAAPPSMTGAAPSPTAGQVVQYTSAGAVAVPVASATQGHAVAYIGLAVFALVAILFMFRSRIG